MIAESRNPTLDNELEMAWLNLKIQGTSYLNAATITRRVQRLSIRNKRDKIAALQLADLVVSPIGRFAIGKPVKEDFRIVETKSRRRGGRYERAGLVIHPKG